MKTEKACRYYKKYKAVYAPKCNCKPCERKFYKKLVNEEYECSGLIAPFKEV